MKILLGYREGRVGSEATEIALKQAKAFGAEVFIVNSHVGGDKTEKQKIDRAEKALTQMGQMFTDEGIKTETHLLVRGLEPGEDIVKFAKEKMVDLIIIGVENRSKVGKLIFGSTAQVVILDAPCPVLTVK